MRTCIFDISNILFRVAAVEKTKSRGSPEDLVGLCMHTSLLSIRKWYNKYNPDKVIFAFEGGNNWRKSYTAKTPEKSILQYKANRIIDPAMDHFYKLISAFKQTISDHTSIICLSVPEMEADDEIAYYCNGYASKENEVVVISGDKDFIQLLKNPYVKLVDPSTGRLRNTPNDKNYESDLDYWLFLKCVRGDMGDYVHSAFPRVREVKVKKAYESEIDRVNFMNEEWSVGSGTDKITYKVGELFEHNKILVSLFDQPEQIKVKLSEEIPKQIETYSKYDHFQFIKFCNRFNLKVIADKSEEYMDIFMCNQIFTKKGLKPRNGNDFLQEEITEKIVKNKSSGLAMADQLKEKLALLRAKQNDLNSKLEF